MPRARARKFCARVIRFLVLLGAIALASVPPVTALAVPPGGWAVYRPALPFPPLDSGSHGRSDKRDAFKLPFDLNVGPKPLSNTQVPTVYPFSWRWAPTQAWYQYPPGWYQAGCYSNGGLAAPWASLTAPIGGAPPTNFTIGSLVDDGPGNLLSSLPSMSGSNLTSSTGGAATGPVSLQYGFQTTPCGTANPYGFW